MRAGVDDERRSRVGAQRAEGDDQDGDGGRGTGMRGGRARARGDLKKRHGRLHIAMAVPPRVGGARPRVSAVFCRGGGAGAAAPGAPADRKQALRRAGVTMEGAPSTGFVRRATRRFPADADAIVICPACSAEVDVSRAGTSPDARASFRRSIAPGNRVDGHRIEARLGGGGLGTVYRGGGRHGRNAAIKLCRRCWPTARTSWRASGRDRRAGRAWSSGRSCACLGPRGGGSPWLAMVLVDGRDLRARIAAGAPAAATAALSVACSLRWPTRTRAVSFTAISSRRTCCWRRTVRGWPTSASRAGSGDADQSDDPADGDRGRPRHAPYMSPEQRRGRDHSAVGLLSAGVMLYEASTGVLPQGAFAPPSEVNRADGRASIGGAAPAAGRSGPPAPPAAGGAALAVALAPRRPRARVIAVSAGALAVMLVGGHPWGLRAPSHGGGKGAETKSIETLATTAPRPAPATSKKQEPVPASHPPPPRAA